MKFSQNYLNKIHLVLLSFSLTLICSCSSTPTEMVISPQVPNSSSINYQNKTAQLSIKDLRNKIHIIEIHTQDKAAQVINTRSDLNTLLHSTISRSLTQSGLTIDSSASNQLLLIIDKAEISVNQSTLQYNTTSVIQLTVKLTSHEQTLTKTFTTSSKSEGVLNADIAVLERDFNQQLSQLIQQIINDKELIAFIN